MAVAELQEHVMAREGPSRDDPITIWIEQLRNSDEGAAERLWAHFVGRLYGVARDKLSAKTRRVYDEEDAVQSAFNSMCAGMAEGRFPDVKDRDSLLRLLLVITARKVARRHQYDHRKRRDVRRTVMSCVFVDSTASTLGQPLEKLPSREPTPEFAAEFADTCNVLFQRLGDPQLQQVATLRIEGYSDAEIAAQLRCSRRTVQRSLEIIRRKCNMPELTGQ